MFEKELEYFKANQDELVKKHNGKILILKDEEICGAYDTTIDAYLDGNKKYGEGSFMIQRCIPGPDAYTVTVASVFDTVYA